MSHNDAQRNEQGWCSVSGCFYLSDVQGIRTVIASNLKTVPVDLGEEAKANNELWIFYPDIDLPDKEVFSHAIFRGDHRAAVAPVLAHKYES
jgi:hypothetical protein